MSELAVALLLAALISPSAPPDVNAPRETAIVRTFPTAADGAPRDVRGKAKAGDTARADGKAAPTPPAAAPAM